MWNYIKKTVGGKPWATKYRCVPLLRSGGKLGRHFFTVLIITRRPDHEKHHSIVRSAYFFTLYRLTGVPGSLYRFFEKYCFEYLYFGCLPIKNQSDLDHTLHGDMICTIVHTKCGLNPTEPWWVNTGITNQNVDKNSKTALTRRG